MAKANASTRMVMQRSFRKLNDLAREVGGANSINVDRASQALVKGIRQVLGERGASVPGQPPRKRSGRLQRSVARGVVTGSMRVGPKLFTAPLQELGAIIPAKKGKKARVIEPRPFMAAGLEVAKPEMTGVTVSELQRKAKGLAD